MVIHYLWASLKFVHTYFGVDFYFGADPEFDSSPVWILS